MDCLQQHLLLQVFRFIHVEFLRNADVLLRCRCRFQRGFLKKSHEQNELFLNNTWLRQMFLLMCNVTYSNWYFEVPGSNFVEVDRINLRR